jgi:Ycf66 protein N-terminus
MMYLGQVNLGTSNQPSLLGIFYILFGMGYLVFTVRWLKNTNKLNASALIFYTRQSLFISILMLLCGFIFTFQGWCLNPNFQIAQILLFALIVYLIVRDIVINILS